MMDFINAAFPFVVLGLALAVWAVIHAKKTETTKPKDAGKPKSR